MTNNTISPVRKWICDTLKNEIPYNGIWSDKNESQFISMTGVSHTFLLKQWFKHKIGTNGKPVFDYNSVGPYPKFTTCTSFLPIFTSRIIRAGRFQGTKPPSIHNWFQLQKNMVPGWSPAWLAFAIGIGPKEGDFYQCGTESVSTHVGVIVEIRGNFWSVVGGGAGGRTSMHDGVKRSMLQPKPNNVFGWLDVDIYFDGWDGSSRP